MYRGGGTDGQSKSDGMVGEEILKCGPMVG